MINISRESMNPVFLFTKSYNNDNTKYFFDVRTI